MLSLIVPTCGGSVLNLARTIDSCAPWCDDAVVICTSPYPDDLEALSELVNTLVVLDWNYVFKNGFGDMHNRGTGHAKNDWCVLLGVAETLAEAYQDVEKRLSWARPNDIFLLDHHNDPNRWTRIWNKGGGPRWSGLIHEAIVGGPHKDVLFRMQDTDKTPLEDPLRREVLKYLKGTSYNAMYRRLLENPSQLGGTDPGWIDFVKGASESIYDYCERHGDLLAAADTGDFDAFESCVYGRMKKGTEDYGVNFKPQGT